MASVTNNAARGLEDFNPFAEQNTSQSSGAKVVHFHTLLLSLSVVGFEFFCFRFVKIHAHSGPLTISEKFRCNKL